MMETLEDQLARVLHDRARSIDQPPAYQLVAETPPAPRVLRPARRMRWGLSVSLAAVAAAVALLVSLAASFGSHRSSLPADGSPCSLTSSHRFMAALRDGLLLPGSTVLAGGRDGSLLVKTDHAGVSTAVDLIGPEGAVWNLWTAGPGERVRALANPSGAVGDSFVAFLLAAPDGGSVRLMVAPRDGAARSVPLSDPGYRLNTDLSSAPLTAGASVTVLESGPGASAQRLASYWPDTDSWTSGGSVSSVTGILPVGGNLVLLRSGPGGTVDLRFTSDDAGLQPSTLAAPARTGYAFASDGTTLTWLTESDGAHFLWRWQPGDPAPTRRALPLGVDPVSATARYVAADSVGTAGGHAAVDMTKHVVATLPADVRLVRVDGGTAVLTQTTGTNLRYSRVPAAVLASCGK